MIPLHLRKSRTTRGGNLLPALLLALVLGMGAPSHKSGASEFQVLRYFTMDDGAHPFADLVQASDGTFYGTTITGNNSADHDTLFLKKPDGTGFAVLTSFGDGTISGNCWGGLLAGSDGMLYGVTYSGGEEEAGTVFTISPDGAGFAVLKDLNASATGGGAYARLMEAADGKLYGVTFLGGDGNAGTVFKLNPDGSAFTVLKHFDNSVTGGHPTGALIQGPGGALYGTTLYGGSFLYGTIFKLQTDGSGYTVLRHLDASTTGSYPHAGLLLGADGALYGVATEGGSFGFGTVFKLNSDGTGFTILKSLDSFTHGAFPCARLIQSGDGKLYGTTLRGGAYDWGTVFEMEPDGTGYRLLRHFDYSTTGGFVYAGVTQGSNGALYGTAGYGWDDDFGTLFRLVPAPNAAPTAEAGEDQLIHAGTIVNLNGNASSDEDIPAIALAYAWNFASRPPGSTATLSDADTATPSFTADLLGDYVVELVVTDDGGLSSQADAVEITSSNQAPTAVAEADNTQVTVGQMVQLDGSSSPDPDGDELTYSWTLGDAPPQSVAALVDANTAYPTLTPDFSGDYKVILTVSDPWGAESTTSIAITATDP